MLRVDSSISVAHHSLSLSTGESERRVVSTDSDWVVLLKPIREEAGVRV